MVFGSQHPSRQLAVLLYCAAILLMAGCASDPPGDPLTLPACPSISSQIYAGDYYPEFRDKEVQAAVEEIYALASTDTITAKREALKLLRYETERWSDVQYVLFDPQPHMRVIVTFITPGLIRAIVLNHYLSKGIISQPDKLKEATKESLAMLDMREEFAFLILIQPQPSTTPVDFLLPPANILLHTTDGFQVRPTHSDDLLNSPLDTSLDLYSGYFFYPAKVTKHGACNYLLTPGLETSVMLRIDNARFIEHTDVTMSWVLHFPLLYKLDDPAFIIDRVTPVNGEDGFESPQLPPAVEHFVRTEDVIPWREIGRFHWWKLVSEGIPAH